MAHDRARECSFVTDRLTVLHWHEVDPHGEALGQPDLDPVSAVVAIMTDRTTQWLPEGWKGSYDRARAEAWLLERDAESPTLLVLDHTAVSAIGLLILFETPLDGDTPNCSIRFGYVLAEDVWGSGLATELVAGLVAWASAHPLVGYLTGGVSLENQASARVLEKNGFAVRELYDREQIYERNVTERAV